MQAHDVWSPILCKPYQIVHGDTIIIKALCDDGIQVSSRRPTVVIGIDINEIQHPCMNSVSFNIKITNYNTARFCSTYICSFVYYDGELIYSKFFTSSSLVALSSALITSVHFVLFRDIVWATAESGNILFFKATRWSAMENGRLCFAIKQQRKNLAKATPLGVWSGGAGPASEGSTCVFFHWWYGVWPFCASKCGNFSSDAPLADPTIGLCWISIFPGQTGLKFWFLQPGILNFAFEGMSTYKRRAWQC